MILKIHPVEHPTACLAPWVACVMLLGLAAGAQAQDAALGTNSPPAQVVTIAQQVPAYSIKNPGTVAGYFPAGSQLEVREVLSNAMARVRFVSPAGRVIEALCRKTDLGLSATPAAGAAPAPAAPPPAGQAVYKDPDWLEDATGYQRALGLQHKHRVPVLLVVYADWNPGCAFLEENLFKSPDFRKLTSGVIKVRINPEHGREEGRLAAQLGVDGYPTCLVIDQPRAPPREIKLLWKGFGKMKVIDPAMTVTLITNPFAVPAAAAAPLGAAAPPAVQINP